MSGSVTPNFRLQKPPFDDIPWDDAVNGNMDIIDAALAQYLTLANFVGVWKNNVAYVTPQVVIDPQDSTFWKCMIAHTSAAATTTFAQDRAARPTLWSPTTPSSPPPPNPVNMQALNNVGRNLLRNSTFNIQQRGQGPFTSVGGAAAASIYTLDGWRLDTQRDVSSISGIILTDNQRAQVADEWATNGLQIQFAGNAAADSFTTVNQPIEFVRMLSGKTVTLSFYASANTPLKFQASFYQNFGTGGSPSPIVLVAGQIVNLTTALTRYTLTFAIPSTAGKVFGTNGNSATFLQLACSYGSATGPGFVQSGAVTLWGVQVEIGANASALAKLSPTLDLMMCERYYTRGSASCFGYTDAGGQIGNWVPFRLVMARTPTITFLNTTYANAGGISSAIPNFAGFVAVAIAPVQGRSIFNTDYTASAE